MTEAETLLQRQALDDAIAELTKANETKAAAALATLRDTKYPLPKVAATLTLGEGVLVSWRGKTLTLQQDGRAVLLRRADLQAAAKHDTEHVDANGDAI